MASSGLLLGASEVDVLHDMLVGNAKKEKQA